MNALWLQQAALRRRVVAPPAAGDGGDDDGMVRGRADIYRRAYPARMVAALRDNFEALPAVMGDDAFDALARAYLEQCPSVRPSIRWFGDRLVAFMGSHPERVAHPAFVDVAQLEWAVRGAFDAADAVALDPRTLAALPAADWANLSFTPLPSVRLLTLGWEVEAAWQALRRSDAVSPAPGRIPEPLPEPLPRDHAVVVWRSGLEVRWRSLDPDAADLLHAALAGGSFAAVCARAVERLGAESAAPYAVTQLQSWLADGLFSAWRLEPTTSR